MALSIACGNSSSQNWPLYQKPETPPITPFNWQFPDSHASILFAQIGNQEQTGWIGGGIDLADLPKARSRVQQIGLADGSNLRQWAGQYAYPDQPNQFIEIEAAKDAELAALLSVAYPDASQSSGSYSFLLQAVSANALAPVWSFQFPSVVTKSALSATGQGRRVAISRQAEIVCALMQDSNQSRLYVLSGRTGEVRQSIAIADRPPSDVAASDDGSTCLVRVNQTAYVFNTTSGNQLFSTHCDSGGYAKLSGDGNTFVCAAPTELNAFRRLGDSYQATFHYPIGGGDGLKETEFTLSRDGQTLALSVGNDTPDNRDTKTTLFDLSTKATLGEYATHVSGKFEDLVRSLAITDNGSSVAVGYLGSGDSHQHPEVIVLDRSANLTDSIQLAGSVNQLDISGDGKYLLVVSRTGHIDDQPVYNGLPFQVTCHKISAQ